MLNDEQIHALKTRSESHKDLWMHDGLGACQPVRSIILQWAGFSEDPTNTQPGVLLDDLRVLPLRTADIADFVTLKPWNGATAPTERDNLTVLQDAARGGLDVNFMTGDVQLPKHLRPSDGAA
jgi:hypothetical protein